MERPRDNMKPKQKRFANCRLGLEVYNCSGLWLVNRRNSLSAPVNGKGDERTGNQNVKQSPAASLYANQQGQLPEKGDQSSDRSLLPESMGDFQTTLSAPLFF